MITKPPTVIVYQYNPLCIHAQKHLKVPSNVGGSMHLNLFNLIFTDTHNSNLIYPKSHRMFVLVEVFQMYNTNKCGLQDTLLNNNILIR